MSAPAGRPQQLTELLLAHSRGDPQALDRLIPLVYDDLRRLARRQLLQERQGHTLNTTAVVHEAYLQFAAQTQASWPDRAHFFAFASQVMRHILIDYARKRQRQKRGGGMIRVPMERVVVGVDDPVIELLALDEALMRLSQEDERMGRVVECRLFAGMTANEIAEALEVSLSTVERDWRFAKAYLYRMLSARVQRDPQGKEAENLAERH